MNGITINASACEEKDICVSSKQPSHIETSGRASVSEVRVGCDKQDELCASYRSSSVCRSWIGVRSGEIVLLTYLRCRCSPSLTLPGLRGSRHFPLQPQCGPRRTRALKKPGDLGHPVTRTSEIPTSFRLTTYTAQPQPPFTHTNPGQPANRVGEHEPCVRQTQPQAVR